jgi:dual specificity tyrosine-phosphorylation-regulated kinase 2/3/4
MHVSAGRAHVADCVRAQVYYVGANAAKPRPTADARENHGFDDERGDYIWAVHDHVAFRFEIVGVLGKGSFGVVTKCYDWKTKQMVALKIIRNKKRFHHQALVEVKLLEHLRDLDRENTAAIVHMREYFYFRNHMCITFEMLSINLYEFIKNNKFQGLSLALIRRIAVQLLLSLRFLRKLRVIHCDLKPENILLKAPNKSSIKVGRQPSGGTCPLPSQALPDVSATDFCVHVFSLLAVRVCDGHQ